MVGPRVLVDEDLVHVGDVVTRPGQLSVGECRGGRCVRRVGGNVDLAGGGLSIPVLRVHLVLDQL